MTFTRMLYRIGRRPDPFELPDHAFAAETRFGDPAREFRVLYLADSPYGALVEALQPFRVDVRVASELRRLDGEDSIEWMGIVPAGWFAERLLGAARVTGTFVEIGHSDTLAHLRLALASEWVPTAIQDLDAAAVRLTEPRAVTQAASRYVYEYRNGDDARPAGVVYRSRFGDDILNVGLHEPFAIESVSVEELSPTSADVIRACRAHGLRPPR